jgi:hypothetical protein
MGLKGISMGPLYVLRGVGGHGLSAYRIPLGPTRGAQQRAVPEPRSGEGCTPPAQRAVTFMQHCIYNATVYRSRPPAREAGTRASAKREHMERIAGAARRDIFATVYPQCNSRAAAHNLCASMRTTYACTTQARLRQYVALTYRVPLISIRGSLINIFNY